MWRSVTGRVVSLQALYYILDLLQDPNAAVEHAARLAVNAILAAGGHWADQVLNPVLRILIDSLDCSKRCLPCTLLMCDFVPAFGTLYLHLLKVTGSFSCEQVRILQMQTEDNDWQDVPVLEVSGVQWSVRK